MYDSTTEDAEGNRSRVDITYGVGYSLPTEVREYSQDGSGYAGFLHRTYYTYNLSQPYLDRRIIGLLESVNVIDENNNDAHRLTYEYDRGGEYLANTPVAATQHHGTNFSSGFVVGRGNRTDIWQWDANDPLNSAKAIRQKHIGYNINGSVIFTRDALNHQKTFSYTDSFSDGNRNTLAFPTTVTDEDNFSSTVQHNFDNSLVTRTQDPKGWVWTYQTFDWAGRPLVTTNPDNSTREIAYGGSGCAGSEVTTLKDERGRRRRLTKGNCYVYLSRRRFDGFSY